MRMFLLMFNENTTIGAAESDRHDLKSFVLNIGKLTQAVTKLDPKSQNKKMNSYLIKPLMDFFLVIPEKYVDPVAEYMVNVLYNCIKSQTPKDVSSMLSSLEPMIVLVCHSKAFVRSAVKTWARIQLQHKLEHPEYEWIHLCDHLDSIRAQLQVKYPGVTFVDTRDPSFVLRVLKCELDEMLAHRQLEKESSLSYETTIMNRTLSLIQTSPPQDPHLSDVCLSCLSLTYKHDAFSQDNAKLKAYVHELKKTLKTMKHPAENGNFRANPNLDDSVVVKAEQSLVTKNTTLCLLLANCYVMEHIEKVHWKRLAQKKSKSSDDGKASRGISDLDKGIEQVLNDTNVFATSMDVMETLEAVKLLDTVALVLSKIVQMDVVLDLEKISSVTKLDRVTSNILYVGYSYRLYLEGDKEIEFWKLALQLSVSNLLWLDEGLRPSHLKKADDLINANVKPPIPQHVKTMYQFARIKQALSLNDLSKANEELSLIQLEHTPVPTVHEMLVMYHSWYLKCQLLMRQPDLSHSEHAFIVQCCDEAFKCLFKNYDTVNHSTPIVVQVISCYLHITLLITKFHTAHLNPQDGRRILSTLLTFTQDMCLPLWTAQLLSLSACLDVITCNKEDLLFKINCLEQVLTSDVTQKTLQNNINSNKNSTHQNSAHSHSNKNSSHQNSANSNANNSQQRPITPPNPVFTRKRGDEAMRDAVVTKQTTISSSLASPRFVSVVSNKLPEFIAHRSCHCFECRNSVYHELLVSLGLLQGLYYQLDGQYELTTFCFQNAEHLLNKLKILKGLPEDQASQWQARLLFYRANLEGILNRASNVLKINQELQLVSSGSDGYFDRYFDMSWQQEQYLMFVGAQLEIRPRKVKKYRTPPKSKPLATQAAQFQTPKVSNLNVQSVFGMDTKYPACKFIKDVVTPKAKVRMTLHFDDDEEESDKKCDGIGGKDDGSGGKVDKIDGKDEKIGEKVDTIGGKVDTIGGKVDTIVGEDGSIDGKVDKRKGSECTPEKKAKEKVKPRTTARKPRRVKFDEPVIVEEEMEMDAVPWSPMTVKTDTKYKSYSSATKPLTQSTKAPILSTFTPLVNDKGTATPNDLHSNQLSPRSSLSMKKTAPRRKVLFDSDEDDVIPMETDVKDELSKDLCNTENKRTDNAKISQTGNTAKTIRNARNGSSDSQTSSENSEVKARPKTTRRRAILESSETSSETSDEVYTTCRKTQPRKPTEANARSGRHAKAKEERIETSTNKKNVRGINKVSGKCLNQLVDAVEDLVETIGDLKIDADTLSGGPSDDLDISNASSYHSCSPTPEKSAPARRKNKVLCFDNEDIENEPAKTRTTQRTSGETSENRANNPCERSAKRLGTVRETKSRSVKCDSQVLDTRSKLPNPLSHRTHSLETKTMTKTQSSRTQSLETKTSITSLETKTTDQSINSNNNLKTRITKSVSKSVQSECTTVKSNAIANSSRFKKPDPPVSKVMPRRTIRKPSDTIDDDLEVKQRLTNTKVFDKTASENYKVFAKNENSTLKSTSSKKTVEMVSSSRDDQENLPPNASRCKTSRAKLCVEESAPCKTSRAKLCVEELAPCKTSRAKIVIDEVPPKAEKPKRKPRAQFPRSPFIL
ncbi:hypothetical protein M8J76_012466 [Diaphorina citri]|nr:hypothetical protein M8J76_012466 [Diaphorina citri]